MNTSRLDDRTTALVERARDTIEAGFSPRHRTAAAIRTADSAVTTGLHLDATISSAGIHAEAIAVGRAITADVGQAAESGGEDPEILGCAAVSKREADSSPNVIPPCGECRELLADYATEARIVVPGDDGPVARQLADLLPADVTTATESPRFG